MGRLESCFIGCAVSRELIMSPMTLELKNRHWMLFFALVVIQCGGLWMSLARSPYGPTVLAFAHRAGWTTFVLPVALVFNSAFATTVILATLTGVFTKRQ